MPGSRHSPRPSRIRARRPLVILGPGGFESTNGIQCSVSQRVPCPGPGRLPQLGDSTRYQKNLTMREPSWPVSGSRHHLRAHSSESTDTAGAAFHELWSRARSLPRASFAGQRSRCPTVLNSSPPGRELCRAPSATTPGQIGHRSVTASAWSGSPHTWRRGLPVLPEGPESAP